MNKQYIISSWNKGTVYCPEDAKQPWTADVTLAKRFPNWQTAEQYAMFDLQMDVFKIYAIDQQQNVIDETAHW